MGAFQDGIRTQDQTGGVQPPNCIAACISSADPVADTVVDFLLRYQEEDDRVDYKLAIEGSDKEWLELTKDIAAFANTHGGYLVVGVRNSNKAVVGIDERAEVLVADVNNIQQKVNRNLEPDICQIRSKVVTRGDKRIGVIYVPASVGRTHVVSKDGSFVQPSGEKATLLRKGTVFVRRSAANHLADSRDFDDLLERRMSHFRETLLNRITKVVEAPRDSEVFVLSKDPDDESGKRFVIRDGPDSIPVKGLSFSVAPEGIDEQIAAWTVISSDNPRVCPPSDVLWGWYLCGENAGLTTAHKLTVARFAMWSDAPVFYWIRGLRAQDIQKTVQFALDHRPPGAMLTGIFRVAAYLGRGFYTRLLASAGKDVEKLAPRMRRFADSGPESMVDLPRQPDGIAIGAARDQLVKEFATIAGNASVLGAAQPGAMARVRAHNIDCWLYAQNDKYA